MVLVRRAVPDDAGEVLTVQRAAFVTEAQINLRVDLPPLTESLAQVRAAIESPDVVVLTAELDGPHGRRLVGSARVQVDASAVAHVGRIAVAPDLHGNGIGSALLLAAESAANDLQPGLAAFELFTGGTSERNIRWYQQMGYVVVRQGTDSAGIPVVILRKPAPL